MYPPSAVVTSTYGCEVKSFAARREVMSVRIVCGAGFIAASARGAEPDCSIEPSRTPLEVSTTARGVGEPGEAGGTGSSGARRARSSRVNSETRTRSE